MISPWILNLGKEALEAGQVTPFQALQELLMSDASAEVLKDNGGGGGRRLDPRTFKPSINPLQELLMSQAQAAEPGTISAAKEEMKQRQADAAAQPPLAFSMPRQKGQTFGDETGQKDVLQQLLLMDPEQFQGAIHNAQDIPGVAEYQRGIEEAEGYKQQIANMGTDPYTGPLSSLLDFLGQRGGESFRQTQPLPAPRDRLKMLAAYQEQVQNQRLQMIDAITKAISAQKGGEYSKTYTQGTAVESADPRLTGGKGTDPSIISTRLWNQYRSYPDYKPNVEAMAGANELLSLAGSKNWLADKQQIMSLLKSSRLAPISELDRTYFAGSSDLYSKASRMVNRIRNGEELTQSDRDVLQAYARAQAKRADEKDKAMAETFAKNNVGDYPMYTEEQIVGKLRRGAGVYKAVEKVLTEKPASKKDYEFRGRKLNLPENWFDDKGVIKPEALKSLEKKYPASK